MSPLEQQKRLDAHGLTLEVAAGLDGYWREYFGLPYNRHGGMIFLDVHKKLHDAEDPQLVKFGE